jgi:hypothetical protein
MKNYLNGYNKIYNNKKRGSSFLTAEMQRTQSALMGFKNTHQRTLYLCGKIILSLLSSTKTLYFLA